MAWHCVWVMGWRENICHSVAILSCSHAGGSGRGCVHLLWRGEEQVQLKLIVVGGVRSGEEVLVTVPKFIIGRDRDCHLRCNSDVVSRHHCALVIESDYVAVVDFSSKNGTFVDGSRVDREEPLRTGSLLAVGPLKFLVQVTSAINTTTKVGDKKSSNVHLDSKTEHSPPPEQIVDDWSDALDPDQMQSSMENLKVLRSDDPHIDASRTKAKSTDVNESENTSAVTDAATQRDAGEKGSGVSEHDGSGPAKDTRTAAMDALRKIGKAEHKKT